MLSRLKAPTSPRQAHGLARSTKRGFTLIELMTVVILIGILSALALPSMLGLSIDEHVYGDANSLNDLFRQARTHAIGRGGAVMIAMDSTAGTYTAYEAVQPNPQLGGANSLPLSSCGSPTNWSLNTAASGTAQNAQQFAQVNLATSFETTNNISAIIYSTSGGSGLQADTTAYLCFTPLGRTYLVEGGSIAAGMFNAAVPMSAALQIEVSRKVGGSPVGIVRSVLVPPNGVTRMLSNSTLVAP